jgi:hypothetical protein
LISQGQTPQSYLLDIRKLAALDTAPPRVVSRAEPELNVKTLLMLNVFAARRTK